MFTNTKLYVNGNVLNPNRKENKASPDSSDVSLRLGEEYYLFRSFTNIVNVQCKRVYSSIECISTCNLYLNAQ